MALLIINIKASLKVLYRYPPLMRTQVWLSLSLSPLFTQAVITSSIRDTNGKSFAAIVLGNSLGMLRFGNGTVISNVLFISVTSIAKLLNF